MFYDFPHHFFITNEVDFSNVDFNYILISYHPMIDEVFKLPFLFLQFPSCLRSHLFLILAASIIDHIHSRYTRGGRKKLNELIYPHHFFESARMMLLLFEISTISNQMKNFLNYF